MLSKKCIVVRQVYCFEPVAFVAHWTTVEPGLAISMFYTYLSNVLYILDVNFYFSLMKFILITILEFID